MCREHKTAWHSCILKMKENKKKKPQRKHVVSTRLTSEEMMCFKRKISGIDGSIKISKSMFLHQACTGGKVKKVDLEVEQYKVFIAARLGNDMNEIILSLKNSELNQDRNIEIYEAILQELKQINDRFNQLIRPLES